MALAAPFPAARATAVARRPVRRPVQRPVQGPARDASSRRAQGLVLTRRGRSVLAALSVLFLALVVLVSGRFSAEAGSSLAEQGRATGVVVVQSGESLWQIAKAVAPMADPRETVTRIRDLNGLGDSTVVAGQSIVVPVAG